MANQSLQRVAARPAPEAEVRLRPREELPSRVKSAFPELVEWDKRSGDIDRGNAEAIRQAIGGATTHGSDYVAVFEEALK